MLGAMKLDEIKKILESNVTTDWRWGEDSDGLPEEVEFDVFMIEHAANELLELFNSYMKEGD